ncbi:PREDICTED: protein Wnt-8b-like [Priapulus caudatus]|uniref:Protein Wnt n=1 Tax=Priapulus caudatus TaxID=37621 RepID=A0A3P3ZKV8_PRICU|nr:PREDICTED: protein Wnt-8b-like [Priapulus caudatus]VAY10402.1 Wnt8 [Priapulus caudatus]
MTCSGQQVNVLVWTAVITLCMFSIQAYSWTLNNFLMSGPKAYLTFSASVAAGAQAGMEECQHQYQWEKWNCPRSSLPLYSHSTPAANSETSFVHAISSAGVMHTLTRNCSAGEFEKCGCDDRKKGQVAAGWTWGGCSDNVQFGEQISKQFVDALETGLDATALMNLHNSEAGRAAVRQTLKRVCKCHGVSGSCSTQTCWLQITEFRQVGNYLKRKYHRAQRVDYKNGELKLGNTGRMEELPSLNKRDLVYLEPSPDYCRTNITEAGSVGTVGRLCSRRKVDSAHRSERKSCKVLCKSCGLKVRKRTIELLTSCNCKFQWCCDVKCEECRETVEKLTCSVI